MNYLVGVHVTYVHEGRTLLGTVVDVEYGSDRLKVKHFNGEPWPVEPLAMEVDVLKREYQCIDCGAWRKDGELDRNGVCKNQEVCDG